jgi:DNA-binding transcriptional MerR regulator
MKVSELAKLLAVTADTVRFYTRNGFLTPKKNPINGYKIYTEQDKQRLNFIISARHLNFSVDEIGLILNEADRGHSACYLVREIIEQKLNETEQQFQQTLALRNRLKMAIKEWQNKPDKKPTAEMICHLIEEFNNGQHIKESK